jgi:hypothetical protein
MKTGRTSEILIFLPLEEKENRTSSQQAMPVRTGRWQNKITLTRSSGRAMKN